MERFVKTIGEFATSGKTNASLEECCRAYCAEFGLLAFIDLVCHPETFGDAIPNLWLRMTEECDNEFGTEYTKGEHYKHLIEQGW